MNLKKRLKKLEEIILQSNDRPALMVFALLKEEWQTGDKDFNGTGMKFEHYLSYGKIPDTSQVKDLEELKRLTNQNMINLYILPVDSLEDVWADERSDNDGLTSGTH